MNNYDAGCCLVKAAKESMGNLVKPKLKGKDRKKPEERAERMLEISVFEKKYQDRIVHFRLLEALRHGRLRNLERVGLTT